MKNRFLALTAILVLESASANAADLSQLPAPAPLPSPVMPTGSSVPNGAFFLGLGGSANWMNFGHQHVYAIGTSDTYMDGVLSASGSAQGPTNIHMEDRFAFAPSFQGGYFQRLGVSDWLWGAKLSYNYLGATSTNTNSIIPQFGTYTTIVNPTPVPFSGPAYVRSAQTSLLQEIDLTPFLGHVFGQSYVYAGGGPTLSQNSDPIEWLGRLCACRWRHCGSVWRSPGLFEFELAVWRRGDDWRNLFPGPDLVSRFELHLCDDARPHRDHCQPVHRL